jgi:caffeoyl-CoA O-methyltransferase
MMNQKQPTSSYHNRILPNQPALIESFTGKDHDRALFDAVCRWSHVEVNGGLTFSEASELGQVDGGSDPVMLGILSFLVKLSNAKRILEVGSFIGVSAMTMAKALPPDGRIITIEKYSKFAGIARQNAEQNGLSEKMTVLNGDANDVIAQLPRDEPFDMIFLDGNKEKYLDLFLMLEPLLTPKGLFLVDDCFFQGDSLNEPPATEKGAGVRAFLEYAAKSKAYQQIVLPVCNGLMLMVRN